MKRWISILCSLSILLFCVPAVSAAAPVTVSGETEFVKAGGSTEYSVSISNNTGMCSYLIYVDCDTNVFSVPYDESDQSYQVERGENFQSGTISCNINGTRGYVVSWYDAGGNSKNGELFRLKMQAKADAAAGEYPITLRYSEKNTLDKNLERLPLTCIPGKITVAPATAQIAAENVSALAGETCTLKVRIDANPGIASYMVYVLLDTSIFQAIPDGDEGAYQITDGNPTARGSILCSAYSNKGYRVTWYAASESVRAGTLFELPLKIAANAKAGTYPVQLKISAADTTNEKGVQVPVSLTDGSITVTAGGWKNVSTASDESAKTVTVTAEPILPVQSGSVSLIAASYSESGQMLSCKLKTVDAAESVAAQSFTLSSAGAGKTSVKLFMLQASDQIPLTEALKIQIN